MKHWLMVNVHATDAILSQSDRGKGGRREDDGPDRTEGDWRSAPKSDSGGGGGKIICLSN